jgi:hypothetical protein
MSDHSMVPSDKTCMCYLVQGIVPREAAVHIALGRVQKRLRNPDAALTAFNIGESAP